MSNELGTPDSGDVVEDVVAEDVPVAAGSPMNVNDLDKILLNTGPSPNGWHKTETAMICLRRRGWDYATVADPGTPWHGDATARGTLLHVGLAHHYRRMQAVQEGENPDLWYEPAVAVALIPKVEENKHDAITLARHVPDVLTALAGYAAEFIHEVKTKRIIAVETVVNFDCIPGMGGLNQPPAKTGRIDLVYASGWGPNAKLFMLDHKSAGRITKTHAWQYSRSGQFLMLRWLAAGLKDKFGGVVLNLVQVGAQGYKTLRPPMDAVPGFMTSLPMSLVFWEQLRLEFEASGLPPEAWPASPSEHNCRGRYASCCPHAAKCDMAVPARTQVDWPQLDLSKVFG
jgi:hypothetical protein